MIQQSENPLMAVGGGVYPPEIVYSSEQFSQVSPAVGKPAKPTRASLEHNRWRLEVGAIPVPATLTGANKL